MVSRPVVQTIGSSSRSTGRGGLYRHYCCSRKLKEGATACKGLRVPTQRLDQIVIDEVSARVLQPQPLEMYLKSAQSRAVEDRQRVASLRQAHKEA
jgi:hypothetical protein